LVTHLSGLEAILAFNTAAIANEAAFVEDGRHAVVFFSESDGLAIGITVDGVEADGIVTFASNLTSIDSHVNSDGGTLAVLEVLSFPVVSSFEGSIRVGRGVESVVFFGKKIFCFGFATILLSAAADGADAAQDAESDETEDDSEDHAASSHGGALRLGAAETVDSAAVGASGVVAVVSADAVCATGVTIDGVSVGLAVEVVVVSTGGGEVVSLGVGGSVSVRFRLGVV